MRSPAQRGEYLDAGEFEQIVAFVQSGGSALAELVRDEAAKAAEKQELLKVLTGEQDPLHSGKNHRWRWDHW